MKEIQQGVLVVLASCFVMLIACSPNNVKQDKSLGSFFTRHGVEGCFAIYDNAKNEFTIYNLERYRDSAFTPASTFKIVNSLVALQTGRVYDEKRDTIRWDGVVRSIPAWNRDLTMEQAFKVSAVPYYQEVARRIGKDTMQLWLDSLKYGNRKISVIDSFWLDNSLQITPDEQLGLVKKLYFTQLIPEKRSQQIVKQMMLQEDNSSYKLSYKTGWAFKENGNSLGWIVGWIEENKHPYFFVLNIEGPHNADIGRIRMEIMKGILTRLNFMKGRK
ncbi:MAG TPA: class D beta-lactamase [Chitinophagaceae bacterium]